MTEDDWRSRFDGRLSSVEMRLNEAERSSAVDGERLKNIERDVHDMKSGVTWLTRLIIGALLLAIIAFLVGGGFSAAP